MYLKYICLQIFSNKINILFITLKLDTNFEHFIVNFIAINIKKNVLYISTLDLIQKY